MNAAGSIAAEILWMCGAISFYTVGCRLYRPFAAKTQYSAGNGRAARG